MNKAKFLPAIALAATALILSCSGDDGITPVCKESTGTWHEGTKDTGTPCIGGGASDPGAPGAPGAGCDTGEDGAYFTMICGGIEKARWPKAMCGMNPYDPKAQFCDSRDNAAYKYVRIDETIWMAEDLAYGSEDGKYDWAAAGSSCPAGWKLPSRNEAESITNTEHFEENVKYWTNDESNANNAYIFKLTPDFEANTELKADKYFVRCLAN